MLSRKDISGFTLLELLASMAIILVAFLNFLYALQAAKLFRERSVERYRAQLVAESITEMIASLSNQDLLTSIASQTNNANPFYTRDITPAFAWLSQWQQADFITDVRFQVNLTRTTPLSVINLPIRPPQVIAQLPADAVQMATYNKEITTEVTYRRQLGAFQETFRWRKVVPHE